MNIQEAAEQVREILDAIALNSKRCQAGDPSCLREAAWNDLARSAIHAEEALRVLLAAVEGQSLAWIKISERAPENKQDVIFFTEWGARGKQYYKGLALQGRFVDGVAYPIMPDGLVNWGWRTNLWMPIPERPNE